jgi:hypothetical protein
MVTQYQHCDSRCRGSLQVVHRKLDAVRFGGQPRGFFAFVEPLGQCRRDDISSLWAEAVRVISIAAYERVRWENSWLTEGLLCECKHFAEDVLEPGWLLPVRANEDQEPGALRFQVKGGAVFFTQKRPSTCRGGYHARYACVPGSCLYMAD